jgi:hypothetical protein
MARAVYVIPEGGGTLKEDKRHDIAPPRCGSYQYLEINISGSSDLRGYKDAEATRTPVSGGNHLIHSPIMKF